MRSNGEKNTKIISCKLKFFESPRFMTSSLSNLVNNLAEGFYKDCEFFCLEYTGVIDDLIEYKCLCCNKNYQKRFDENIEKRFFNTYKFSKHVIN